MANRIGNATYIQQRKASLQEQIDQLYERSREFFALCNHTWEDGTTALKVHVTTCSCCPESTYTACEACGQEIDPLTGGIPVLGGDGFPAYSGEDLVKTLDGFTEVVANLGTRIVGEDYGHLTWDPAYLTLPPAR